MTQAFRCAACNGFRSLLGRRKIRIGGVLQYACGECADKQAIVIRVKLINGLHVTNKIGGQAMSSAASYEAAAQALARKVRPGVEPVLARRPALCRPGEEVFEVAPCA